MRIGRETDAKYQWTKVAMLVVARDGSVIVLDDRAKSVTRYDRDGRYLNTIGRIGSGPGEFRSVSNVGLRRDTLWLVDRTLRRVLLFSLSGQSIQAIAAEVAATNPLFSASIPSAAFADGSLLLSPTASRKVFAMPASTTASLLRYDPSGSSRTMVDIRLGSIGMLLGPETVFAYQPFADGDLWGVGPLGEEVVLVNRVAATETPAFFEVTRLLPSGQRSSAVRYPYLPVSLARSAVDSAIAGGVAELSNTPQPKGPALERLIEQGLYIPRYRPPVVELIVGHDGLVAIRRELRRPDGAHLWEILGPRGERLAHIWTVERASIVQVQEGWVWTVEKNDLDEPTIYRNRIRNR